MEWSHLATDKSNAGVLLESSGWTLQDLMVITIGAVIEIYSMPKDMKNEKSGVFMKMVYYNG